MKEVRFGKSEDSKKQFQVHHFKSPEIKDGTSFSKKKKEQIYDQFFGMNFQRKKSGERKVTNPFHKKDRTKLKMKIERTQSNNIPIGTKVVNSNLRGVA